MKFDNISKFFLFGGSLLIAEFAEYLKNNSDYELAIYSCERQINEVLHIDGRTLGDLFDDADIQYHSTDEISLEREFIDSIDENSIGIGFGEAWTFSKEIIDKFDGRLLDLMGIRLPRYVGGAHYSWQILLSNRMGGCNLQMITEDMVQGVCHPGDIVKGHTYLLPSTVRIPDDYFAECSKEELKFLCEFIEEIETGKDFVPFPMQLNFTQFYPRLNTMKHGWIDWSWDTVDIDSFICAFDEPYMGASTLYSGERVFLKKCRAEYDDGSFHPFQRGMVYKIDCGAIWISTNKGSIVVEEICDESGRSLIGSIECGMRFFTPVEKLEEALRYSANYSAKGLSE